MVTKILPVDYFLFFACFTMLGICYYKFVVQPKKQLEEASSLRSELSVANTMEAVTNPQSIEDDFEEFEKKYRIVKSKNEIISNYLKNKIGYESVHEELQKVDLVTGERKETVSIIEPLKRPTMGHLPNLIADTYEESLISSGLVYETHHLKCIRGESLEMAQKVIERGKFNHFECFT